MDFLISDVKSFNATHQDFYDFPWGIVTWLQNLSVPVIVDIIAFTFAFTAATVSFIHILNHLRHNKQKALRKYTNRILLMVPIFSADASFSLLVGSSDQQWTEVFMVFRELYEAFVLWSFLQFFLAYLVKEGDLFELCSKMVQHDVPVGSTEHLPPVNLFLKQWTPGPEFVVNNLAGVFQYVIVNVLLTIAAVTTWSLGVYKQEHYTWQSAHTYIVVVRSVSQAWAMYNLVLFYHVWWPCIAPVHPLWKFLCIKGLIFFTFWQMVLLGLLRKAGVFNVSSLFESDRWSQDEISVAAQNFLICVEMLIFAFAHMTAYPHNEHEHMAGNQLVNNSLQNLSEAHMGTHVIQLVRETNFLDVYHDMLGLNRIWGLTQKLAGPKQAERTVQLLEDHRLRQHPGVNRPSIDINPSAASSLRGSIIAPQSVPSRPVPGVEEAVRLVRQSPPPRPR